MPLVNIIESIDGEKRFLPAVDTTDHKKNMHYLLTLVEPNICADTDLLVIDGACGGLLTLVEQKHPRYKLQVNKALQVFSFKFSADARPRKTGKQDRKQGVKEKHEDKKMWRTACLVCLV